MQPNASLDHRPTAELQHIDAALRGQPGPNLILISVSYGYNANGTQNLTVNVGNPFPNEAVTGNVRVDW